VLGVMMFLMSIGVSTLAAAFANSGYIIRQSDFARVRLLSDSIHENIMHSLQHDPEDEELLGYQIAMAIFNANDGDGAGLPTTTKEDEGLILVHSIDNLPITPLGSRIILESIKLSFPEQIISHIHGPEPYEPQYPPPPATGDEIITPERERVPRTAKLNASMIVEVIIRSGDRRITSIAFYRYTDGELSDDPDEMYSRVKEEDIPPLDMVFVPGEFGRWEMIRHEVIDWQG